MATKITYYSFPTKVNFKSFTPNQTEKIDIFRQNRISDAPFFVSLPNE